MSHDLLKKSRTRGSKRREKKEKGEKKLKLNSNQQKQIKWDVFAHQIVQDLKACLKPIFAL